MLDGTLRASSARMYISLENIPLVVRDVPKHPDDGYASDQDVKPIHDKEFVYFDNYVTGNLRMGLGLIWPKGYIAIGIEELMGINNHAGDSRLERNYTNYPGTGMRGEGAALTYYGIESEGPAGIFFRYSGPILRNDSGVVNGASFILDYNYYPSKLKMSNGWDRWDRYEKWKDFDAGKVETHMLSIGVLYYNYMFQISSSVGYMMNFWTPTTQFKDSKMRTNDNFYIDLKVGFWLPAIL